MLNISIVLYYPKLDQVCHLVQTLLSAQTIKNIYLLDNSPISIGDDGLKKMILSKKIHYIWNEGENLGYGRAHNIAIRESVWQRTKYHLVMNADIEVQAEDIDRLYNFMEHNANVGQVMPRVVYPNGELQYLCKLLPTPWDVFARRFLPDFIGKKRRFRYELRHTGYRDIMNVPYLSGCFMFLRTEAVLQARLFDERYFMYPEDIDLTRTIHRNYLTLYVPEITIVHHHAKGSYKSWHLLWVHVVNMCRYFNKWGWFVDRERSEINRLTLQLCNSEKS